VHEELAADHEVHLQAPSPGTRRTLPSREIIFIELMASDCNLRRPERARNEGTTTPKRLDDTPCTTYRRQTSNCLQSLRRWTFQMKRSGSDSGLGFQTCGSHKPQIKTNQLRPRNPSPSPSPSTPFTLSVKHQIKPTPKTNKIKFDHIIHHQAHREPW